jgi:hypothetical protein
MTIEYSPRNAGSRSIAIFKSPERRTVASYERELTRHRRTEIGLREAPTVTAASVSSASS